MRFIIIFTLTFSSLVLAQNNLSINWNCVKSDITSSIPDRLELVVPFDNKKATIDTINLENFINTVISEPNFDYSICLSQFSSELKSKIDARENLNQDLKEKFKVLNNTIYSKATFYALENYQKKFPLFLPLNPVSYTLDNSENASIIETMINKCETPEEIPREYFLSETFLKNILKPNLLKIKNKSHTCFLKLKNNLLNLVHSYFQTPNECRQSKFCKNYQSAVAQYIQEIGHLFNDVSLIDKKTVKTICNNNFNAFFNTLLQKKEELEEITNCVELKNGESRIIKKSNESSSFKIEKINNKTNKITLNFVFSKDNDQNLSKLQSCFKENQNKMKDKLGNVVIFSFISDEKSIEINAEKIAILESGRANSLEWLNHDVMSCSTMIHETLHHLGLSDEYNESSTGVKVNHNDKMLESFEESSNFTVKAIKDKSFLITYNFIFSKKNDETIEKLNLCFQKHQVKVVNNNKLEFNIQFISDPDSKETIAQKVDLQFKGRSSLSKINCGELITTTLKHVNLINDDFMIKYNDIDPKKIKSSFSYTIKPNNDFLNVYDCRIKSPKDSIMSDQARALKGQSIFYPAQLRTITNLGCTKKYRIYNLCAAEAYKTSLKNYGDYSRCNPALPKECKNGSAAWLQ